MDVVQEVFCTVSRSIFCFQCDRSSGSFRGWLLSVTRSRLGDFLRSRERRFRGSGDTGIRQQLQQAPAEELSRDFWQEEYERSVFRWAAEQIQPRFSKSSWSAFWQTSVENRPVSEVAAALEMSRGAVYIARSRVPAKLREKIEELEDD